jgi:hypothetical protein
MIYYFGDRITADSSDELQAFVNALGLHPGHCKDNCMTVHLGAAAIQKAKRFGAIRVAPRKFITIRDEALADERSRSIAGAARNDLRNEVCASGQNA